MTRLNPKFIGTGIAIGLLLFFLGMMDVHIRLITGFNAPIWIPCGIAFSTLFLLGLEYWPFLFISNLALLFWISYLPLAAILAAVGNITICYYAARFLRNRLSSNTSLERLRDLFLFVGMATLLLPILLSSIDVIIQFVSGDLPIDKLFFTWRGWWIGQGMSTLVVGGVAINLRNDRKHWWPIVQQRKWEALFLFLVMTGMCIFIFTPMAQYTHSLLIKPYVLFSLRLWSTLRFDLFGATMTSFIITAIAHVGGLLGFVAFASSNIDPTERMVMLQFYLGAITLTGLVVATTVREKSEALDARNEFLDIASHELKTPITSLKLQLQLLQRRLGKQPELTPAEIDQLTFLTKVDRQVNRLVKIVEQLLDVSRAERKVMDLELENISLNDLISQLTERMSSDIQNAKCTLRVDLSGELTGFWDPFRVEQILENLISNAIKYASGHSIEVKGAIKGNRVELSVQDSGPGIDPAKLHTVFDRFVRANETRHVQGLGLGLFITRKIVEAHGGLIFVDSALGKGTTFTVILPVKMIQSVSSHSTEKSLAH
jgi:signal transduction histidine kinase